MDSTRDIDVKNTHRGCVFEEIERLQGEIMCSARTSLEKAIQIGSLLTELRSETLHGSWGKLCRTSLPFTERTASNYMRLFEHRERLKSETVSDLSVAYRLLSGRDRMSKVEAKACLEGLKRGIQEIIEGIDRLLEIRESRLYSPEFSTFAEFLEVYCNTSPTLFERRLQWCRDFLRAQEGHGNLVDVLNRLADGELNENQE